MAIVLAEQDGAPASNVTRDAEPRAASSSSDVDLVARPVQGRRSGSGVPPGT